VSWLSSSAVRCVCCGHDGSGSVEIGRAGRRSMMMMLLMCSWLWQRWRSRRGVTLTRLARVVFMPVVCVVGVV